MSTLDIQALVARIDAQDARINAQDARIDAQNVRIDAIAQNVSFDARTENATGEARIPATGTQRDSVLRAVPLIAYTSIIKAKNLYVRYCSRCVPMLKSPRLPPNLYLRSRTLHTIKGMLRDSFEVRRPRHVRSEEWAGPRLPTTERRRASAAGSPKVLQVMRHARRTLLGGPSTAHPAANAVSAEHHCCMRPRARVLGGIGRRAHGHIFSPLGIQERRRSHRARHRSGA